jgi:hypothetical protein
MSRLEMVRTYLTLAALCKYEVVHETLAMYAEALGYKMPHARPPEVFRPALEELQQALKESTHERPAPDLSKLRASPEALDWTRKDEER